MATMASFLKKVPSRIVISENGQEDDNDSEGLGLERSWAVMDYLATKQGLDKNHFSISVSSTVTQNSSKGGEPGRSEAKAERVLEIVLLERSIYN